MIVNKARKQCFSENFTDLSISAAKRNLPNNTYRRLKAKIIMAEHFLKKAGDLFFVYNLKDDLMQKPSCYKTTRKY